jgi:hypothetical protein
MPPSVIGQIAGHAHVNLSVHHFGFAEPQSGGGQVRQSSSKVHSFAGEKAANPSASASRQLT